MNEHQAFNELRKRAWQYPLVRKADTITLHERHTVMFPNGVAVALSLNR